MDENENDEEEDIKLELSDEIIVIELTDEIDVEWIPSVLLIV